MVVEVEVVVIMTMMMMMVGDDGIGGNTSDDTASVGETANGESLLYRHIGSFLLMRQKMMMM